MRTGTAPPPPTGGSYTPSAPFVQPVQPKARRQPALLALGLALVGVSAAGFVYWNQQADAKTAVLVLARDVPAGQKLEAADLQTVQLALVKGVQAISAESEPAVLTKVATTQLHTGALLTSGDIGSAPTVPAGTDVVAVTLKPEITPTLTPGRNVLLVANKTWPLTLATSPSDVKLPAESLFPVTPLTYKATVVAIAGNKVTFAVQHADAVVVEQFANDPGRLGVVLLPNGS